MTIISAGPIVRVQNISLSPDQVHGSEQAFFTLGRYFIPAAINNFPPENLAPQLTLTIGATYANGFNDFKFGLPADLQESLVGGAPIVLNLGSATTREFVSSQELLERVNAELYRVAQEAVSAIGQGF